MTEIDRILNSQWSVLAAMQWSSTPDWVELSLTMAQVKTLFVVAHKDGATVSRVAEYLQIGQPSASQLVEKLVKKGMATRTEDPLDRRRSLVNLTEAGYDLVAKLYRGGEEVYRKWVSWMSAEDRKALEQGLAALLQATGPETEQSQSS